MNSKLKKISQEEFESKFCNIGNSYVAIKEHDLSGYDLSNINLSRNVIISNTNLKNTNINININNALFYNVNLQGTNLYDNYDIKKNEEMLSEQSIKLFNVLLDDNNISFINNLIEIFPNRISIDVDTFKNNENLKMNYYLLTWMRRYNSKYDMFEYTSDCYYDIAADILERCAGIKKLYDNVKDQLVKNKFDDGSPRFYIGSCKISNVTFKNIVIDEEMFQYLLGFFYIEHCSFENVTFDFDFAKYFNPHDNKKLVDMMGHSNFYDTKMKDIYIPHIKTSDWNKLLGPNFPGTPMTFRRNLYLQLGMGCNASCKFCRNNCLEKTLYDYEKIDYNLGKVIKYVNEIVIGGGEPSLYYNDIIKLINKYYKYGYLFKIFTNGTNIENIEEIYNAINHDLKIYLSRHHYNDIENADIFGINYTNISNPNDYGSYAKSLVLHCVCNKNGISNSKDIINYINRFQGYNIIFSNLQKDTSVFCEKIGDLYINDNIFDEAIEYLKVNGYECSLPIISTGGYEMYILKGKDNKIVFKKYINEKTLEYKWPRTLKRTFDLSMSSNGAIYENWSNKGEKVLIK